MTLADAVKRHAMAHEARVLTLDIETAAPLVNTWGLFNQNIGINQIERDGFVMGVGMKWLGDKRPWFVSDHTDGHESMIQQTFDAVSQADVIVTYNGDGFDLRHLNWEFELAGLGKPKPYRTIDLLKVHRSNFRTLSNKLDFVVQRLELGAKTKHAGFELWRECLAGDEKAWRKMATYCKQDVHLTEQLMLRYLQWLPGSAHIGVMSGKERSCPNCGGEDLTPAGTTYTALTEYALHQCDNCRTWVRTNYVKGRSTIRAVR